MNIAKYRSEASYAHSHRKGGGCSSKQVKLLRNATKAYNRAGRRAKKEIIANNIKEHQREPTPICQGVYHAWGSDPFVYFY